ncbi:MAG: Hsp20/alpha crystallin family protein [Anaerolineales bacterium]
MMTMYISPYRRMSNLREAMNRLMEDNMNDTTPVEREMQLAVDVLAEDEAYTISALVPGVDPDDINIEILNNTVAIRGEFKDVEKKDSKYLVCELPSGRFSRVLTLPTALDPAKAEANLKNGLFTLRVPKAEAHRPKVIKINK